MVEDNFRELIKSHELTKQEISNRVGGTDKVLGHLRLVFISYLVSVKNEHLYRVNEHHERNKINKSKEKGVIYCSTMKNNKINKDKKVT